MRLTAGDGRTGDTLHRIVMNAHRELNALAAGLATETLDGAHAFGLSEPDRPLVRAFMRGVHRTAALKFDHPGLDTLATRAGTELVLQNDLGETDAHVIVIRVAGPIVTITYTDVHLTRLLFFQELLAPAGLAWDDTRSRSDRSIEGGLFHLVVGRLEVSDDVALESFLELLGSRLVFMIDWNRARKRLRRLVGRRAALALLTWAAEHDYGHMAFLLVGGDGLVYEALEFAGGRPARAGESLADVLGDGPAESYMRAVLRICSRGSAGGRPDRARPGRGAHGADRIRALGPAGDPRTRPASRRALRRDRRRCQRRARAGGSPGTRSVASPTRRGRAGASTRLTGS